MSANNARISSPNECLSLTSALLIVVERKTWRAWPSTTAASSNEAPACKFSRYRVTMNRA
jgi:hypothetical protein